MLTIIRQCHFTTPNVLNKRRPVSKSNKTTYVHPYYQLQREDVKYISFSNATLVYIRHPKCVVIMPTEHWQALSEVQCFQRFSRFMWLCVTFMCDFYSANILTIISSDNGWLPGRRQIIIWTNAGMLLIGPLGTTFSEIYIKVHTFSFKKMLLEMSCGHWRPFGFVTNLLRW